MDRITFDLIRSVSIQISASLGGLPGLLVKAPLPDNQVEDHRPYSRRSAPTISFTNSSQAFTLESSAPDLPRHLFATSPSLLSPFSTSRRSPVPLELPGSLRLFSTSNAAPGGPANDQKGDPGKAQHGTGAGGGAEKVASQPLGEEKDPAAAQAKIDEEKQVADLQILGTLSVYLWPKDRPDFKRRVAFALSLLVASKVCCHPSACVQFAHA
jgi:hypothetical protein